MRPWVSGESFKMLAAPKQDVSEWLRAREIITSAESLSPRLDATQKRARDSTPDIIDIDELKSDDDDIVIVKHMVCLLAFVPLLTLRAVPGPRRYNLEQQTSKDQR
jgi:hypothetical protein